MILPLSLLSLLSLGSGQQRPAPDLSEHQERVVKIVMPNETGAGIVLGTEGDHIIIATALHVVQGSAKDQCKTDDEVRVAFQFRHDSFAGARVAACRREVDLAILDLVAPPVAAALSEQPPLCAAEPRPGGQAYVIGHHLKDWATGAESIVDTAFEGDSRRFMLTGAMTGRGASGGMVLDDGPCLLGVYTDHAATASIATRTLEAVKLAESNRLSVNLMGGDSPIDHERRRRVFNDVSETFNDYLFKLEAVSAFFARQKLLSAELAQITTEYNSAFNKWYLRRTALSEDIRSQWGTRRADDFDRVTGTLYSLHNRIVYNQLADMVATLSTKKELSSKEQKQLRALLPQLDAQLAASRQEVTKLLASMKPLLSGSP
jgi:Trypsin-like peptidase domain